MVSHHSLCNEEGLWTSNWQVHRPLEYLAYKTKSKKKKVSRGPCVDGLPEQSSLRDKVILEKSASLLESLATERVIPVAHATVY